MILKWIELKKKKVRSEWERPKKDQSDTNTGQRHLKRKKKGGRYRMKWSDEIDFFTCLTKWTFNARFQGFIISTLKKKYYIQTYYEILYNFLPVHGMSKQVFEGFSGHSQNPSKTRHSSSHVSAL